MELIDRAALEKHLAELAHLNRLPRDTKELSVVDVEELIDHQRTVDAEPVVHARWVPQTWYDEDAEKDRRAGYRCSACWQASAVKYRYCQGCGASMDADAPERAGT